MSTCKNITERHFAPLIPLGDVSPLAAHNGRSRRELASQGTAKSQAYDSLNSEYSAKPSVIGTVKTDSLGAVYCQGADGYRLGIGDLGTPPVGPKGPLQQ